MTDRLSAEARSRIMRAIRNKNTKPELIIRKSLFALGYRYRIHPKHLPGKPDLSFPSKKKAIFVHGCFWHQHAAKTCPIRVVPSSNTQYWGPKLLRNAARDREHTAALRKLGWNVLVIWECELRRDEQKTLSKIERFLA